jgi:thiol-disulfide isomerase/thioredoxin
MDLAAITIGVALLNACSVSRNQPDALIISWPEQNADESFSFADKDGNIIGKWAENLQGQQMPEPLEDHVAWISEKPAHLDQKVILIDFWATWCQPCLQMSDTFDRLSKEFPDELVIVAVSNTKMHGDTQDDISEWVQDHTMHYTHAHDDQAKLAKAFGINGIPHVVVVSTDGVIRWQGSPYAESFEDSLRTIIDVDPGLPDDESETHEDT